LVGGLAGEVVGAREGETGKYGVETILTVKSPFMSRIGENTDENIFFNRWKNG
jgi:hypothetical protein